MHPGPDAHVAHVTDINDDVALHEGVPRIARIVHITRYGNRYHRRDCEKLRGSQTIIRLTLVDALNRGKVPCKVCNPDDP